MKLIYIVVLLEIFSCQLLTGQSWQREAPEEIPLQLFSSMEALNLPTGETLNNGDFYFHISHKFLIPVSEGINELFGFDGGVQMRLALGYGITDNLSVFLGRANRDGNIDLQLKYKAIELNNDFLPSVITINGGIAYNSKLKPEPEDKSKLWQIYGNLIFNSYIGKNFGFGVVPSFLYNSNCNCSEVQTTTTLGLYAQYHFDERWSLIAEANPTLNGWRQYYDTYSFGAELETAGHFFKIQLSNNINTNMTQFLGGALDKFEKGDLHIGFIIQRIL